MNDLIEIANRMITKTGLTAEPNGDDVDILLRGHTLGRLSAAEDPALLMYTSADGYDATGTEEDIQGVIQKDLDNQFVFDEIAPGSFKETVESANISEYLRAAILEAYDVYRKMI